MCSSDLVAAGVYFMAKRKSGGGGGCCGGHAHGGHDADSGSDADAKNAKDPICGMDVKITDETLQSSYKDKTYYFCSSSCVEKFEKEPQMWIGDETDEK